MNYESPEIEVIEVVVEAGFAVSTGTEVGDGNQIDKVNVPTKVIF